MHFTAVWGDFSHNEKVPRKKKLTVARKKCRVSRANNNNVQDNLCARHFVCERFCAFNVYHFSECAMRILSGLEIKNCAQTACRVVDGIIYTFNTFNKNKILIRTKF